MTSRMDNIESTSISLTKQILRTGDPRSPEYALGLQWRLSWHLQGRPKGTVICACPYSSGTAQADAYFAGSERADFEWRISDRPWSQIAKLQRADEGGDP